MTRSPAEKVAIFKEFAERLHEEGFISDEWYQDIQKAMAGKSAEEFDAEQAAIMKRVPDEAKGEIEHMIRKYLGIKDQ